MKTNATLLYCSEQSYNDKVTGELKTYRSALFKVGEVSFKLSLKPEQYSDVKDLVKTEGTLELKLTSFQEKPAIQFSSFEW